MLQLSGSHHPDLPWRNDSRIWNQSSLKFCRGSQSIGIGLSGLARRSLEYCSFRQMRSRPSCSSQHGTILVLPTPYEILLAHLSAQMGHRTIRFSFLSIAYTNDPWSASFSATVGYSFQLSQQAKRGLSSVNLASKLPSMMRQNLVGHSERSRTRILSDLSWGTMALYSRKSPCGR